MHAADAGPPGRGGQEPAGHGARTIFVTGATGYVAKHVVLAALRAGHRVVGSTRDLSRGAALRATLARHLGAEVGPERLRLVRLDLLEDDGWCGAMAGCDALIHTATPVPVRQPRDPEALIAPAVGGTLRALRAAAAAGIGRVIVTSSAAAITGGAPNADGLHDETCWTDPGAPGTPAYNRAKTLAERAAWDFAARDAPGLALTSINPVVVVGPPLDADYGASVYVVARLLKARDPVLPRLGMTLVDVRDVAQAHLAALDRPGTAGERYFLNDRFLWMTEIAETLRAACPHRRIARRVAPDLLVRAIGLIDRDVAALVPRLGVETRSANRKARTELGLRFRDVRESLRDTALVLDENGWIG